MALPYAPVRIGYRQHAASDTLWEEQEELANARDAKQRDGYRAILLALEGQEAPAIARTLGRSGQFVQEWVYRYRDHGLEAVVPKPQTGRPTKLPTTKEEPFKARFLAEPTEADGVCTLRAKEAQRILRKEFRVRYPARMICSIARVRCDTCFNEQSPWQPYVSRWTDKAD